MFGICTKSHIPVSIGARKWEDTAYSLPSSNTYFWENK